MTALLAVLALLGAQARPAAQLPRGGDDPRTGAPIEASAPAPRTVQGVLERRARELEVELGVPVTVEAEGAGAPLTSLRVGRADAPEIALIDSELIAPVGPEEGGARIARALGLARALGPRAAAKDGGVPVDYAVLIALGPAERNEASLAVARDLNFPTRWLEARARHGDRAGLFPGERIEVAGIVDWLLAPGRIGCIGAVELGGATSPGADGRWPAGSLGAFVSEGMSRGFGAASDLDGAARAMVALRRSAPEIHVEVVSRHRLGGETWVVDLRVSWRRGVEAGQPARRVRLDVRARGLEAPAWIGTAARPPGARAHTVLAPSGGGGSARTLELPCAGATALRVVVHGAGEAPELSLRLASPGAVAAPLAVSLASLEGPGASDGRR